MAPAPEPREMPSVLRLRGAIQHYAWGTADFIPSLLGRPNAGNLPFAELWMGAHPDLPSLVQLEAAEVPLDEFIAERPDAILGRRDSRRFAGELPYLFKVLSAAVPLSVQAHPSREQAVAGFDREEAAGIPITAPDRCYKDRNRKPELLAAVTEFFALRGFRPLDQISGLGRRVPELASLVADFTATASGLRRLYEKLMRLEQRQVDRVLGALIERLSAEHRVRNFGPGEREYWLLEADRRFSRDGHHDRGLFSVYLLNLVQLQPGEAFYLPAGVLHAYLQGTGMELMASSNNVLRGGLTPKHIDVEELLRVVVFEAAEPELIRPEPIGNDVECAYPTPAEEFELRRIDLPENGRFESGRAHGVDIIIVIDAGQDTGLSLISERDQLSLDRGDIFLVPADVHFSLVTRSPATLFRATVPAPPL